MTIMESIKAKMTGQQSAVDGRIASEIRGKLPVGQESAGTPMMDKVREKLPAQQNTGGPVRNMVGKVVGKANGNGNGNGNGNADVPLDTAGMFGDERTEQSPRGLRMSGNSGLFGKDLG